VSRDPRDRLPSVTDHFYWYFLGVFLLSAVAFWGVKFLLRGGAGWLMLGAAMTVVAAAVTGAALTYITRPVRDCESNQRTATNSKAPLACGREGVDRRDGGRAAPPVRG
jgi:hypothetical protein